MATKTFDPNRVGGGTFELVQDAATGKYSYNKVGFQPLKSLTIPDLGAATTTPPAKKLPVEDEADISKPFEQLSKQTGGGGGEGIDYTGQMLKEARKINPQIDAQANVKRLMTQDSAYTTQPSMISQKETISDAQKQGQGTTYQDDIMRGGTGVKAAEKTIPGIKVDKKPIRPFGFLDFGSKTFKDRPEYKSTTPEAKAAMTSDDAQLGIQQVESTQPTIGSFGTDPTSLVGGTDLEADAGAKPRADIEVAPTGLKKVSTGLKSLSDSVGAILSSGPIMTLAKAAVTETPVNKHDKKYFNVRGGSVDGQRIAGNPATDLYAGMNRVSAFGNLEKAGDKRIARREKTIAKKGYGPGDKFYEDTQNMKKQASNYKASKSKATLGPAGGATTGGGGNGGGNGGGRVICTELNKTGELSTKDLVRDIKFTYRNLSKKHLKGYLAWAIPTVKHIKKYPTYRKVWKHVAQHRANDIAWRMKEGKFDLLGRIYAGIGEPLCWLIGNFVNDTNYNLLNNKRNRHL